MLRSLRDGAKSGLLKFILMGLLLLAASGLVLTDVGGFFRGGVGATDVAKGKGFKISAQEFDRTARRTLSQQNINTQQAYQFGLIDQILNREIQSRMISMEAMKYGLRVSDDAVLKQISQLTESLTEGGQSKKIALKQVLRSQGISEGEFINAIRGDIRNSIFRSAITSGAETISDDTAKDLYQFENEKRDVEYFNLTDASVKNIEAPSELQLEKYYDTIKNQFLIPERRSITIATLKQEALESSVKITDEELKDSYENNIIQYSQPEKRSVQQAILSSSDEAQKVLDATKSGKSLEKSVIKITGKKVSYIGENNFSKDGLLEEIADPVFNAKKGDVIGPIKTALGFHIIKLTKISPKHTKSFDEVKSSIKKDLLQERLIDEMMDTANLIDDRLASGEELESIVSEVGLTTEKFKDFSMAGTNKEDKNLFTAYQNDSSEILKAAFEYGEKETSPVMELADGRFITVRVDNITPRSYKPYKEVKSVVKKQWFETQRNAANLLRVSDVIKKIKEGASFAEVAKENGAIVKTRKKLGRYSEVKYPLTDNALRRVFKTGINQPISEKNKDGHIILQATELYLPDPSKASDEDLAKIKEQNKSAISEDIMTQYMNSLSGKYKVRINKRLLDKMYGARVQQ